MPPPDNTEVEQQCAGSDGELADHGSNTTLNTNYSQKTSRRRLDESSLHLGSVLSHPWTVASHFISRNTLNSSMQDLAHIQAETFIPPSGPVLPFAASKNVVTKFGDKPDTGYAWIVLACSITLQMLPCIPIASAGVMYTEFRLEFSHISDSAVSLVCSLQSALAMMMGPFAAFLMDKTSARVCAMIGCIGSGLALLIASLTTSFELLLICYGVITGFSLCCVYLPSAVHSAQFFDRYRPMALGLATCSVPLVFIIVPPIVIWLVEMFGWRMATAFLSAVCMQGTFFAALLRSPRYDNATLLVQYGRTHSRFSSHRTFLRSNGLISSRSHQTSQYSVYVPHTDVPIETGFDHIPAHPQMLTLNNDQYMPIKSEPHLETILESAPLEIKAAPVDLKEPDSDNDRKQPGRCDDVNQEQCDAARETQPPVSSLPHRIKGKLSAIKAAIGWKIVLFLTASLVWGFGGNLFYVLLPEYTGLVGLTSSELSYLYMISGVAGTTWRFSLVLTGHFFDYSKTVAMVVGFVLMALSFFGLLVADSFWLFILIVIVQGAGYAVVACFTSPVILEMDGDKRLGLILGLQVFCYGLGAVISPPISAMLFSIKKVHTVSLTMTASLTLVAGLLFLPHIISQCSSRCRPTTLADISDSEECNKDSP